jgi:hypothetical protein
MRLHHLNAGNFGRFIKYFLPTFIRLFGTFYNGSNGGDDPEDRSVLEILRKIEQQYRKWGQIEQANRISKEILAMESSSRAKRSSRYRPTSPHSSQTESGFGPDIRAESTGKCFSLKIGILMAFSRIK